MDRLDAMASFVRVVESGSFVAAARGRGLSAPMVGNHVRYLEGRLGARLLHRTTRQQTVTDLGRAYYERCRAILADLDEADALAETADTVPRGLLRISASHAVGLTVLPDIIGRYLDEFPDMAIDLHLGEKRVDLIAEGFDAVIRGGVLPDSGQTMRRLPPLALVVCAAPDYLARRGHPREPADLGQHDCLDFAASATPGRWRFENGRRVTEARIGGRLRSNSGNVLRAAALQGRGIIMQPDLLVRDDLLAGRLVALMPQARPQSRPIQIVSLAKPTQAAKLRSFVDHVVGEFRRLRQTARG